MINQEWSKQECDDSISENKIVEINKCLNGLLFKILGITCNCELIKEALEVFVKVMVNPRHV